MPGDDRFEEAIEALLDGRPLASIDALSRTGPSIDDPLSVIDAIASVHRTAIFGTDVSPDPVLRKQWGYLDLRHELGRGASGTVYRAWDPQLAREVALKLIAPEAGARDALEEGRLLARLNHPHIVKVFGADSHDEVAGIWMELLEGETLDAILDRDGVFGVEETLLIGLDLAGALSAVHASGLLHRDVKARNVLRERGGRIVLMDLGAGRGVDQTAGGDGTGTPMYMAPEVLAESAATAQSDVYSLGVLLYRMLTGSYPVTATDLERLQAAHTSGARIPLIAARPDVPADVVQAIERSCDPNPGDRYASAAEFEAGLTHALQRTLALRPSVVSPAMRKWARWRKPILTGAAIVALTLITAWAIWDTTPVRATRRSLGLAVAPRSPLYLTTTGAVGIVRGRRVTLYPHNPGTAMAIAVSSDLGIRTMAGVPPWTAGGSFQLDGTPAPGPLASNAGLCCFSDGTTDGRYNYAARQDSTLLAPVGSRPLAPPGLYRFERDWAKPQLLFALAPEGVYVGVAFSAASNSFWLTRNNAEGAVVEQWSRDGRHLSTPIVLRAAALLGIAADPRDGSLWAVREAWEAATIRLENFTASGRHLGSLVVESPVRIGAGGAEFEWGSR